MKKNVVSATTRTGCRSGYEGLKREFSIAALVIRARNRANLTQAELAERVGLSPSSVAGLEGSDEPSESTLILLAGASRVRLKTRPKPTPAA